MDGRRDDLNNRRDVFVAERTLIDAVVSRNVAKSLYQKSITGWLENVAKDRPALFFSRTEGEPEDSVPIPFEIVELMTRFGLCNEPRPWASETLVLYCIADTKIIRFR